MNSILDDEGKKIVNEIIRRVSYDAEVDRLRDEIKELEYKNAILEDKIKNNRL